MSVVRIRPIEDADTANIVRWRNSQAVKKNLIQQTPITEESHRQYLAKYVYTKQVYQFVISVVDEDTCMDIGSCFVKNINLEQRAAEIGIFIGEDAARGKGYAKYAMTELLKFAYETLGMQTIFLLVLDTNEVAKIVYQKLGFAVVGEPVDGVFIRMELKKEEFDAASSKFKKGEAL